MPRPRRARPSARSMASTIRCSSQYLRWLGLVLQGDWGMSIQQRIPVLAARPRKVPDNAHSYRRGRLVRRSRRHRRGHRFGGEAEHVDRSHHPDRLGVRAEHAALLAGPHRHLCLLGSASLAADRRPPFLQRRQDAPRPAPASGHAGDRRRPDAGGDHRARHAIGDAGGHESRFHDGAARQGPRRAGGHPRARLPQRSARRWSA